MFTTKARAFLSGAPFLCSALWQVLVIPTNFRLGWKGLLRTFVNYGRKQFYNTGNRCKQSPPSSVNHEVSEVVIENSHLGRKLSEQGPMLLYFLRL